MVAGWLAGTLTDLVLKKTGPMLGTWDHYRTFGLGYCGKYFSDCGRQQVVAGEEYELSVFAGAGRSLGWIPSKFVGRFFASD